MFWIFVFVLVLGQLTTTLKAKVNENDTNRTEVGLDSLFDKLTTMLQTKCQKKLGILNYVFVMFKFNNILKCFPDPNVYGMCIHPESEKCVKRFVKTLNKCLNSDEKYLPKLLLEVYGKLCSHGRGRGGVNYIKSIPCNNNIKEIIEETVNLKCLSEMHFLTNLNQRTISLNNQHVCGDIHIVGECLLGAFKKGCELSEEHINTLTSALEGLLTTCISHTTV
ncbi:hypothetical protein RI129_004065 [Pyrocoelia pectoralis]|uniref:Uncharacterized protein n=1 Tax=Pyrocoelia pectoralis TaxID=417401 RepID=A0AAN7VS42_9COLE